MGQDGRANERFTFGSCENDLTPVDKCDSESDEFIFSMNTDNSGKDISWKVMVKTSRDEFDNYLKRGAKTGDKYGDNEFYTEKYCLPKGDW